MTSPDDAGALLEGLIRGVAQLAHGVEHPAVHRLEPVAHVGQGAADDDRHGVGDKGFLDLLLQVDGLQAAIVLLIEIQACSPHPD